MTLNKIELHCKCGNNEADVQAKVSRMVKDKMGYAIQVKCTGCNTNFFLAEDDKRCQEFFK